MDLFWCIKDDYAAKILISGNQITLDLAWPNTSGAAV
jgi:hypothetical protein